MKKSIIAFIIICSTVLSACYYDNNVRIGFDSDFNESSNGLSILAADRYTETLTLAGSISVTTGSVEVIISDPNGNIAWTQTFTAPCEEIFLQILSRCTDTGSLIM
jgi:predicted small secreted protein